MALDLSSKWEAYRPSKTQAFWLAAGSVAATLVLGFGFAGWVSGATAQKMQADATAAARQELAAAICVDEFMAAKGAKATLAKLQAAGWFERSELIQSGGWATMPDRTEPNRDVAILCAAKLGETKL